MALRFVRRTICVGALAPLLLGQPPRAEQLMTRALHLADLYNWADAAPVFTEAEQLFTAAGDQRNAFYAKLGRIRSNIEREEQTLPAVSAELEDALDDNPLLQKDKQLRMFCLIVKGDIDAETNAGMMRRDWEQVQALAKELADTKWQYRALAQLGAAAFYDADLETARKDAATALAAATSAADRGAQIRFLTMLGSALVQTKMFEQAITYLEKAVTIASGIPDAGYQFTAQEQRIEALVGLKQIEAAQQLADEALTRAREGRRSAHEATIRVLRADIDEARDDRRAALAELDQAIALGEAAGLTRLLAEMYARRANIERGNGDLVQAQHFAELAAASTQASGDVWAVPQRLHILAEIRVAQGQFAEANSVYDRAEAFIDSLIGRASTALEKTAFVTASSQIYSQHFSLVADHFNDPGKAYAVIEQVRGRVSADLLAAGSTSTPNARDTEREISRLQLKLMAARSNAEVRSLRDQIFTAEEARSLSPGVSVLKSQLPTTVPIDKVEQILAPSTVLLEYVMAEPKSYCLIVSSNGARIASLTGELQIESHISAYVNAVKAKLPAISEARRLYDDLIRPIGEAGHAQTLFIVRDGQLYSVPFDALKDPAGRFVLDTQTIIYSPSATAFYLLTHEKRQRGGASALLGVGAIPYSTSQMNRSGVSRGADRGKFADLPSSGDEVAIARDAFPQRGTKLLLGTSATETAFKAADLADYRIIHLAVHGFADTALPERAALVFLSDPAAGDDGYLQAPEVAQLHFKADVVVLSACDTAVGPLQGQEGVANLSKAFLLAGAHSVISTLWQVDDTSSLFLMKRFYAHLLEKQSVALALTAAKRDMLRTFGQKAVPYEWAAFTIEGADAQVVIPTRSTK
jgi:CHAT domain-containing protein